MREWFGYTILMVKLYYKKTNDSYYIVSCYRSYEENVIKKEYRLPVYDDVLDIDNYVNMLLNDYTEDGIDLELVLVGEQEKTDKIKEKIEELAPYIKVSTETR